MQNDRITSGKYTILFELLQLASGANENSLAARAYSGASLGQPPHFDGTDVWPIDPASLTNPPDLASATQFPQGYLSGDTWVGRASSDVTVVLDVGSPMLLMVKHAIVAMTMDPTHTSVTNGTIAGILSVDTLLAQINQVAGSIDPTLCSGPSINSILAQAAQAADILQDGSQDSTKVCDGVSIGLGFDAHVVKLGAVAMATTPQPAPCP